MAAREYSKTPVKAVAAPATVGRLKIPLYHWDRRRFPGRWELQVRARNTAALRFWSSCIEEATGSAPQTHEARAPDGRRVPHEFSVER